MVTKIFILRFVTKRPLKVTGPVQFSWKIGCSYVGEGCWRKTRMLVKTKIFSRTYFSPTYRKVFTNILHQHLFKFLFKIFTNIQYFSPTYSTFHQHTEKFSPTYFTNIHLHFCLHQHTDNSSPTNFFSPTSLQPKNYPFILESSLIFDF